MKSPRYPLPPDGEDGWSTWIVPLPGFRSMCGNCNIVHDMEFKAFLNDKNDISIAYRTRENKRATAATRREKKRKTKK